jgi:hypothetical protein
MRFEVFAKMSQDDSSALALPNLDEDRDRAGILARLVQMVL